MTTGMFSINDVKDMITAGKRLLLAGDEAALRELPNGSWIGGTIPYFMAEQGGVCTQDAVFVTQLPEDVLSVQTKIYDEKNIANIYNDAPEQGFSTMIIPATSPTHLDFALNAPQFENFATRPLIGWISGVLLDDLGTVTPKVFDGTQGKAFENAAVVLNAELPEDKLVDIGIVNIFEQGDGDTITFPQNGFSAQEAVVNGDKVNFADYLAEKKVDTKLPLVADLFGAMINTSFKGVDESNKQVDFYAPVFEGIEYKIARPVGDYVKDFQSQIPQGAGDHLVFSCNCILNYLYAGLEGKKTAEFTGPVTFGEIAYQLLNQTLAYITIENI
ncbi:MAG: hypothetical protein P8010_10940 [Desulfosarcinaceae bacterium]|jgi:hypothetical protein